MRHVRRALREGGTGELQGVSVACAASPWPLSTLMVLELHLAMDMILTACRYDIIIIIIIILNSKETIY